MRDAGILNAKHLKLFEGYSQELQAEINEGVLGLLYDVELSDWNKFGKFAKQRTNNSEIPMMCSFRPVSEGKSYGTKSKIMVVHI